VVASIYILVGSTPNKDGVGNNDTQFSLPKEKLSKEKTSSNARLILRKAVFNKSA